MTDVVFVLTPDDLLHRDPREECELDGRQVVDSETADALLSLGQATKCGRCHESKE